MYTADAVAGITVAVACPGAQPCVMLWAWRDTDASRPSCTPAVGVSRGRLDGAPDGMPDALRRDAVRAKVAPASLLLSDGTYGKG